MRQNPFKHLVNAVFILTVISFFAAGAQSFAEEKDWFKALQTTITMTGPNKNAEMDRVVNMAIKSGVQIYVLLKTAVAIDENAVVQVIQFATRVTNDPGTVVKAAVLADIDSTIILNSVLFNPDTAAIIASSINAGANIKTVVSTCVKKGIDPQVVVSSAISASQNVSGVIDASVKAGISPKAIILGAAPKTPKDTEQVVSAYINSGGDVYSVTTAGIETNSDWCGILISALGSSNNYYQVIKAALDKNVGSKDIMDCVTASPSIDKNAVASAIETAKAALAYTPAETRRDGLRRDSISTERKRGSVSRF
jgi:hypothetical protein